MRTQFPMFIKAMDQLFVKPEDLRTHRNVVEHNDHVRNEEVVNSIPHLPNLKDIVLTCVDHRSLILDDLGSPVTGSDAKIMNKFFQKYSRPVKHCTFKFYGEMVTNISSDSSLFLPNQSYHLESIAFSIREGFVFEDFVANLPKTIKSVELVNFEAPTPLHICKSLLGLNTSSVKNSLQHLSLEIAFSSDSYSGFASSQISFPEDAFPNLKVLRCLVFFAFTRQTTCHLNMLSSLILCGQNIEILELELELEFDEQLE
jgi:hypothetical protein